MVRHLIFKLYFMMSPVHLIVSW